MIKLDLTPVQVRPIQPLNTESVRTRPVSRLNLTPVRVKPLSPEEDMQLQFDRANAAMAPKPAQPEPFIQYEPEQGFDPEGADYDYDTARAAGEKPDETGHWGSIDPRTSMVLKGIKHPTIQKTIDAEEQRGYQIVKMDDGRYYSVPKQAESRDTLPDRFKKQYYNKTVADLNKPYITPDLIASANERAKQRADEQFRDAFMLVDQGALNRKQTENDYFKVLNQFQQEEQAKLSTTGKRFDVAAPLTTGEKLTDAGAGLASIGTQFAVMRKAAGPMPSPVLFEAQNVAEGGAPGRGVVTGKILEATGKIPVKGALGKYALQPSAAGAVFAGQTAIEGGDTVDILTSFFTPHIYAAVEGGMGKLEKTKTVQVAKAKIEMAKNGQSVPNEVYDTVWENATKANKLQSDLKAGKITEQDYNAGVAEIQKSNDFLKKKTVKAKLVQRPAPKPGRTEDTQTATVPTASPVQPTQGAAAKPAAPLTQESWKFPQDWTVTQNADGGYTATGPIRKKDGSIAPGARMVQTFDKDWKMLKSYGTYAKADTATPAVSPQNIPVTPVSSPSSATGAAPAAPVVKPAPKQSDTFSPEEINGLTKLGYRKIDIARMPVSQGRQLLTSPAKPAEESVPASNSAEVPGAGIRGAESTTAPVTPSQRIIIRRGSYDPVNVIFSDEDSKLVFQGLAIERKKGSLKEGSFKNPGILKFVQDRLGASISQLIEWRDSVKAQANNLPKTGELEIRPQGITEFLKQSKTASEPLQEGAAKPEAAPVVVYHGKYSGTKTGKGFGGLHVGTKKASEQRLSSIYESEKSRLGPVGAKENLGEPEIKEMQLDVSKIYRADNPIDELASEYKILEIPNSEQRKELVNQGYKGVAYINSTEDSGSTSYLIWDNSAIKTEISSPSSTSGPVASLPGQNIPLREKLRTKFKNVSEEQIQAVEALWEANAETQGKSLDQWVADNVADVTSEQATEDALFQQNNPIFYSKLTQLVTDKMPPAMSADQMRQWIKGQGIKDEEMEWSGLNELSGKVTKQQVLDTLAANNIQIEEVVKGEPVKISNKDAVEMLNNGRRVYWYRYFDGNRVEMHGEESITSPISAYREAVEKGEAEWREGGTDVSGGPTEGTKFESYQLPGGQNYREMLLRLPVTDFSAISHAKHIKDLKWEVYYKDGGYDVVFAHDENKAKLQALEILNSIKGKDTGYKSPHWEETNILAHVRFNDRTDVDGNRVLFIEEIQSDWHQAGREKGYRAENLTPDKFEIKKGDTGYEVYHKETGTQIYKMTYFDTDTDALDRLKQDLANGQLNKLMASIINSENKTVPNAPFKKTWPELAFKRMLRYAAENGYDSIAWTTGEQQAERYDLSKHIDRIEYEKVYDDDKQPNGLYEINVMDKNGRTVINEDEVSLDRISELVGKEIAEKIKNDEGHDIERGKYREWKALSGLDLKVGGEGMKGFYDQILPATVNKYVKKWGGRVGETKINTGQRNVKHTYTGPEATLDQVNKVVEITRKSGPDIYESPITGERLDGAINRSTIARQAEELYYNMKSGMSFKDAIEKESIALAEIFGGDVKVSDEIMNEPVHSLPLTPDLIKSVMAGQPLFQGKKAAVQFLADGKAVIHAFENADISSLVHETGHIFRRQLPEEDRQLTEKLFNVKDGNWTREQEERFARSFERYLADGKAPTPKLKSIFQKFKDWLLSIYQKLVGSDIDVKISKELRGVFDRLLGGKKKATGKQEAVAGEPTEGKITTQEKVKQKIKTKAEEILPRKEEIVQQLTDAYKTAPSKSEYKADVHGKLHFEIDGGINVLNHKDAIGFVLNNVKAMPKTLTTAAKPSLSRQNPIAAKKEVTLELIPTESKEYFTDGRIIIKGEIPKNAKYRDKVAGSKYTEENPLPDKVAQEYLKPWQQTKPAEFSHYAVREIEQGEGVSKKPVPTLGEEGIPAAIFKSNGGYTHYNQNYFNMIRNRYPKAEYRITDTGLLVAYENGKPVAAVMPFNAFGDKPFSKKPMLEYDSTSPQNKPKTAKTSGGKSTGKAGFPATAAKPTLNLEPETMPKKTVSKQKIIAYLSKAFNVPIRTMATHKPKTASGWYEVVPKGIRMVNSKNIDTAIHEIGHHLDHGLNIRETANTPKIKGEFSKLGKALYGTRKPEAGYIREGIAEFVRKFVYGDAALKTDAPEASKWFEDEFSKNNPDIRELIDKAADLYKIYREQGARARIREMRVMGDLKKGFTDKVRSLVLSAEKNLRDRFSPLLRGMEKAGIDRTKLKPTDDPYMLAQVFANTADATAEFWALQGMTDTAGKVTGPSLREILKPVTKDIERFIDWAQAAKDIQLHGLGINPGTELADVQHIYEKDKNPIYEKALQEWTEWNRGGLKYMVDVGALPRETYDAIIKKHPIYIPTLRAFEQGEYRKKSSGTGKGFVESGSPVKKIKGSDRPRVDPIMGSLENQSKMLSASHKFMVSKALARLAGKEGVADLIWEVPAPQKVVQFNAEKVKDQLEDTFGVDMSGVENDDILTIFTNAEQYRGKENIVSITIDGKKRWFEVNPELYDVLKGMDKVSLPSFIRIFFAAPARLVRLGATGLNAAFSIIRNPIRDIGTFAITAEHAKTPLAAVGGLARQASVKLAEALDPLGVHLPESQTARKFQALGGEMSSQILLDRQGQKYIRSTVLASSGKKYVIHTFLHPIDAMRNMFGITEAGPRLGEFKPALEKGEQLYGAGTQDAALFALAASQDVTVNFGRGGTWSRVINETIPFFNAAIQGQDKIIRTFAKNPIRTLLRGLAYLTLAALYLWWKNKDEEWYNEMPDYEKFNYQHYQVEDGTIYRWPTPFELGHLFQTLPVAYVDSWYRTSKGEESHEFLDAVKFSMEQNNPLDWPAAISPYFDIKQNKDFSGRPIVPRSVEGKLPQDQYGPRTTGLMKYLGSQMGFSPAQLEYAVNSYSGGLYKRVYNLLDGNEGEATKSDIPAIGTLFMREPGYPAKTVETYYKKFGELSQKNQSDVATVTEEVQLSHMLESNKKLKQYRIELLTTKTSEERQAIYKKMNESLQYGLRDITDRDIKLEMIGIRNKDGSIRKGQEQKYKALSDELKRRRKQ